MLPGLLSVELRTKDKAMLTAQSCTEGHGHVLLGKW